MTEFFWRDELTDETIRDELDRRHPERIKLRPIDVSGLRQAFDVVEEMWAPTIERARQLPPLMLHQRVNEEYSFVETLRHLLFAWDAFLTRMVLGVPNTYHEWSVPSHLPPDAPPDTGPDLDPVLEVRAERLAWVRDYLSRATAEDLTNVASSPDQWPDDREVLYCFHVVLNEEWWHHKYATRDLASFDPK